MEKGYKHISLEERDRIAEMKSLGHTGADIAIAIGYSKSTLSRELRRRNATPAYKVYLSHRAYEHAVKRKQTAGSRPRLISDEVVSFVRHKLEQVLSPEPIAGRIGLEHSGLSISHETIYHPKTEGRAELIGHLVRGHRKRKSKGIGRKERKTKIPNRIPIGTRPQSVETRHRFGHWEGTAVYIDGQLKVQRKDLSILNPGERVAGKLVLGNSAEGKYFWTGAVYALSLYDKELSPEESLRHYEAWIDSKEFSPGNEPALFARYLFHEQSGSVIKDYSGMGNDLLIPLRFTPLKRLLLTPPYIDFHVNRVVSYYSSDQSTLRTLHS